MISVRPPGVARAWDTIARHFPLREAISHAAKRRAGADGIAPGRRGQLGERVCDGLVLDIEELLRAGNAQAGRFEGQEHDEGDEAQEGRGGADQHS